MSTVRDELVPVLIVGVLLGVYAFLLVGGRMVPDMLEALVSAVVGFYFGAKATNVGRANGGAPHPPPGGSVTTIETRASPPPTD